MAAESRAENFWTLYWFQINKAKKEALQVVRRQKHTKVKSKPLQKRLQEGVHATLPNIPKSLSKLHVESVIKKKTTKASSFWSYSLAGRGLCRSIMSFLDEPFSSCDEKQLLVQVRPSSRIAGLNLDLQNRANTMASSINCSPSSPTTTVSTNTTMHLMLSENEEARLRFEELQAQAELVDLSEIEATNCIYVAGVDKHNRPVVVVIGKWFLYAHLDLDKALLYLIRKLKPVVEAGDYTVVYFHTRTTRDNIPHYWWIKHVYSTLNYEYKKRLKAFYVVHPTLWTKMTCWWFTTFMAPAIKQKMHNVNALAFLFSTLSVDQDTLELPVFIEEYDMRINGTRYYKQ